jgi:hypothetical protein
MLEPKCKKSKIEIVEPKRVKPKIDIVDPMRAILLKESDEPRLT